jgi:ribosomal protein L37E
MFCRNCGKELNSGAVACVACGMSPSNGTQFCQNCGAETYSNSIVCTKCGVGLVTKPEGKDWLTTLLLCIFVGVLGIHRFYTGYTLIGIIQLLTGGACGLWTLIDLILIATGSYKDSDGNVLHKK